MQRRRLFSLLMISSLAIILTACGFKLRGTASLPSELNPLYIKSVSPFNQVTLSFQRLLPDLGINVVESPDKAAAILDLLSIDYAQRNQTVGGNDQSEQYAISYHVTYQLLDKTGKKIIGPLSTTARGYLATNANEVISSTPQLYDIQRTLQQEIVMQVSYQLSSQDVKQALRDMNTATAGKDTTSKADSNAPAN